MIPITAVQELADRIYEFAKKNRVRKIISLGGIAIKGEQNTVYSITSMPELSLEISKVKGVEMIKEGATTGVTGVLLAQGAVEKFPIISLLAESQQGYMDPKAAAMVLEVLKKVIGVSIDTSALEEEAEKIDSRVKNLMSKVKTAHTQYKKVEQDASLGPMYG